MGLCQSFDGTGYRSWKVNLKMEKLLIGFVDFIFSPVWGPLLLLILLAVLIILRRSLIFLIFLSLLLIPFAIAIGSAGCFLYFCLVSFTILGLVSLIVGGFSTVAIIRKFNIKGVYAFLGVLLIATYLLIPQVVAYRSLGYFHEKSTEKFSREVSKESREQQFASVKVGKITRVENNLVYECEECGYKLTFPGDWGFRESVPSPPNVDRSSTHYGFRFTTANFIEFTEKYQGQKFGISSFSDIEQYRYPIIVGSIDIWRSKITDFGIGVVSGKMKKSYLGKDTIPPNEVTVQFSGNGRKFEIYAKYKDETELDQNLRLLLQDFKFIP